MAWPYDMTDPNAQPPYGDPAQPWMGGGSTFDAGTSPLPEPNFGPTAEQALPQDYWARMAQSQGASPFSDIHFTQHTPGGGGLALLALLSAIGNAKAAHAANRVATVEQQNKQARENAKALAEHRWRSRENQAQRDMVQANIAATQQGLNTRAQTTAAGRERMLKLGNVEVIQPNGSSIFVPASAVTGATAPGQSTGLTVKGGPKLVGKQPSPVDLGDSRSLAQGIYDGTIPPDIIQGRPTKQTLSVVSELRKIDPKFNMAKSQLDYRAIKQHVTTLNQNTQVRLRQASENAGKTLDYIDQLNDQLTALIPRSSVTALNKVGLAAVVNGAYGPQAAEIASKLQGQVAVAQSELANVYSGGFAPTDESRRMASNVLHGDWAPNRIKAGTQAGRRDINLRLTAVQDQGAVSPSNPLVPGAGPAASFNIGQNAMPMTQAPTGQFAVTDPNGKPHTFPSQAAAAAFKNAAGIK